MVKKTRCFILVFILWLLTWNGNAQVKQVSLKNQLWSLDNNEFYIDSVIDCSNQNGCIGFELKGTDFRQAPLFFENAFTRELQDFYSVNLPEGNEGSPLLIVVNKLLVSEYHVSDIIINIAEANLSFIVFKNGRYYEIFRSGANSDQEGKGTGSSGRNISISLFYCYRDFINRAKQGQLYEKDVDLGEMMASKQTEPFQIEQVRDTVKGIYYTFYDFLENNIDTKAKFSIDCIAATGKRPEKAEAVWTNENKRISDVWGFSDGHRFFMRINQDYYPVHRVDGHYQVTAFREGTSLSDLGPVIAAGLFAGLVGAAFGVMVIPTVSTEKAGIVDLELDLQSGMIFPSNFSDYKEMTSRIVVYLSRYLKENASMDVYADGELLCTLSRNTYYFLRLPPSKSKVDLCLKSGDKELCETIQVLPYESRVYLCKVKEGETPEKDELNQTMRLNILEKVNSGEITRSCPTN